MSKKIEFRCSIPELQSALKFGGNIGRVTFEVPQSEVENAVALIALQGQALKVTVEIDDGNTKKTDNTEADKAESKSGGSRPWLRKARGVAGRKPK